MTILVLATAGVGLALVVTGLPFMRVEKLTGRTLPYLKRWVGRPSSTMPRGRTRGMSYARQRAFEDIQRRLEASGSKSTPEGFRIEQLVWTSGAIAGLALLVAIALSAGVDVDPRAIGPLVVIVGAIGFVARDRALSRSVELRKSKALEELPVAIDLLTLAVMSGETIPAACARVARLLPSGIGDELLGVTAYIRAGKPADEALESLSYRLPDPAVRRLVDALCVAMDRGAPLADVLRAQADDLREGQRRRMLEMGGRREVLMLLPVVFLIMPVVILFALFPGLATLDLLVP